MIKSRNQGSHTYNQKIAEEISDKIKVRYHPLFQCSLRRMQEIASSRSIRGYLTRR